MWNRLVRTVAPDPVVTVEEFKLDRRIDSTAENTRLTDLIGAATESIDGPHGIGIAIKAQTWQMTLNGFPAMIGVPLAPVQSVESIEYIDTHGDSQTLADYQVEMRSPARIAPAYNEAWPATRAVFNAVTVTFVAGWDEVPYDLYQAIMLLAGHWYENREAVVVGPSATELPMAVNSILERYRVGRFG